MLSDTTIDCIVSDIVMIAHQEIFSDSQVQIPIPNEEEIRVKLREKVKDYLVDEEVRMGRMQPGKFPGFAGYDGRYARLAGYRWPYPGD